MPHRPGDGYPATAPPVPLPPVPDGPAPGQPGLSSRCGWHSDIDHDEQPCSQPATAMHVVHATDLADFAAGPAAAKRVVLLLCPRHSGPAGA